MNIRNILRPDTAPYRLPSTVTSFNYTDLAPSVQYKCAVNASTSTGTGPTAYIMVWTVSVGGCSVAVYKV